MIQKGTRQQQSRFLVWFSLGFYWLIKLEWLAVAFAAPLLLFPTVRPLWTVVTLIVLAVNDGGDNRAGVWLCPGGEPCAP